MNPIVENHARTSARNEYTQLYRHYDEEGELLYVGVSLSTVQRLANHRDDSSWFKEIRSVTIEGFETRKQALAAERKAVENERPKYNVKLQAKKPFIAPAAEPDDPERTVVHRFVTFAPVYKLNEAAHVLGMPPSRLRAMVEHGEIGYINLCENNPKIKRAGWRITGWQLLEFIESLPTHGKSNVVRLRRNYG